MSNKLLNTGALLFFGVISLGLIISNVSSGTYKTSNVTVSQISFQDDFLINYAELHQLVSDPVHDIQFIDLRQPKSFAGGHIPGATNIPGDQILSKKFRNLLKGESTKILYSEKENETVYAAVLLLGKGYDNIRVVAGNYEMIEAHVLTGGFDPAYSHYRDDKARFDYPRFMNSGDAEQSREANQKSPDIPQIQTGEITVQGGC